MGVHRAILTCTYMCIAQDVMGKSPAIYLPYKINRDELHVVFVTTVYWFAKSSFSPI